MNNSQVAHLWANWTSASARDSAHGSHYRFERTSLSSYAMHIGEIVTHKRRRCALIVDSWPSHSTAVHVGVANKAASHLPRFHVPSLEPRHKKNIAYYRAAIIKRGQAVLRACGAIKDREDDLYELVKEANAYTAFFGLKAKFEAPSKDAIDEAVAKQAMAIKARDRKEAKEAEKRLEKLAVEIEAWKQGKSDSLARYGFAGETIFLRVVGDQLETSRGATVPLKHALRLLPRIRSGVPYQHNGHSLRAGEFAITSIDEAGNVTAGCHTIQRDEIERVAALLDK